MSYLADGRENFSEFLAAWSTADQSLPNLAPNSEINPNITLTVASTIINGEATLVSNELRTNSSPALFMGDAMSTTFGAPNRFNMYCIEFEDNSLTRSAAYQDQRAIAIDDLCYAVSDKAKLKIEILYRSGGYLIATFIRSIGMMISQ